MMAGAVDSVQNPTSPFSQNPFSEHVVYFFASILYRHLHDVTSVAAFADRLVDLGQRYDMRAATIDGANSKAWVSATQGDAEAGIARMRMGIDEYFAMNHRMFQPQRLGISERCPAACTCLLCRRRNARRSACAEPAYR